MQSTCGQCLYYLAGVPGIDAGPCFGMPPTPMLLPMGRGIMPAGGASGSSVQAQLQGIRVMVQAADRACSLYRPAVAH